VKVLVSKSEWRSIAEPGKIKMLFADRHNNAIAYARRQAKKTVIIDTAGRLGSRMISDERD